MIRKGIILLLLFAQLTAGMHKALIMIDLCVYHMHLAIETTPAHDCQIHSSSEDNLPTSGHYVYVIHFDYSIPAVPTFALNPIRTVELFQYQVPMSSLHAFTQWVPPAIS